jgi:Transketolase, C-terminal subunit
MGEFANMREAVAAALLDIAAADPAVVVVCPDSMKAMRLLHFAEAFPKRIFEVGIAEQFAVTFAAGLASCGLKPYVATYAGFLTMRACEQMRTFVAYPGLDVKFIGANGGMAAGEREGPTHQFFEDLAIARLLPGFAVVAPCEPEEAGAALKALAARPGPAYLRVGGSKDPAIPSAMEGFELGKLRVELETGSDLAILACGPVLSRARKAAEELTASGLGVVLAEVHTLKPLDEEGLASLLRRTGAAVTVEDHLISGGLGGAVAEAAAAASSVPIERLGLVDRFPESGEAERLLDKYGLSPAAIAAAGRRVVARKNESQRKLEQASHKV